jgi:hypothetical protein
MSRVGSRPWRLSASKASRSSSTTPRNSRSASAGRATARARQGSARPMLSRLRSTTTSRPAAATSRSPTRPSRSPAASSTSGTARRPNPRGSSAASSAAKRLARQTFGQKFAARGSAPRFVTGSGNRAPCDPPSRVGSWGRARYARAAYVFPCVCPQGAGAYPVALGALAREESGHMPTTLGPSLLDRLVDRL